MRLVGGREKSEMGRKPLPTFFGVKDLGHFVRYSIEDSTQLAGGELGERREKERRGGRKRRIEELTSIAPFRKPIPTCSPASVPNKPGGSITHRVHRSCFSGLETA